MELISSNNRLFGEYIPGFNFLNYISTLEFALIEVSIDKVWM